LLLTEGTVISLSLVFVFLALPEVQQLTVPAYQLLFGDSIDLVFSHLASVDVF
jgi:hypothetical protein